MAAPIINDQIKSFQKYDSIEWAKKTTVGTVYVHICKECNRACFRADQDNTSPWTHQLVNNIVLLHFKGRDVKSNVNQKSGDIFLEATGPIIEKRYTLPLKTEIWELDLGGQLSALPNSFSYWNQAEIAHNNAAHKIKNSKKVST